MNKNEALKQIAGFTLSQFMGPHDMALACVDIARKTLAQPEQELVCVCGAVWEGQELVLTPPQRKPLTDEKIDEIYFKSSLEVDSRCEEIYDFARAIEAAHGIKE